MSGEFQLAQLNIAKMKFDWEDPGMQGFVDELEPVNATADASPGFVWRHKDQEGEDEDNLIWGDPGWLVNMSVWDNLDALRTFIRSERHLAIMKRRREWFSEMVEVYIVLWWVPTGHQPTVAEAQVRLEKLRAEGPGPEAFSFVKPFPPPSVQVAAALGS